jgi:hypothetical protein
MSGAEELHLIWWVFGGIAGVVLFVLFRITDSLHQIDKRLVAIETRLGIENGKTKFHNTAG